jgi:hypothetical protein
MGEFGIGGDDRPADRQQFLSMEPILELAIPDHVA